jgi:hypothetical protein
MNKLACLPVFAVALLALNSASAFAKSGDWVQIGQAGAWKPTLSGPDFGNTRFMFTMGRDLYTIETDGSLYRVAP